VSAGPPGEAVTVTRTAGQIGPGDAVVVRGLGTVAVREVVPLPSGELLIVLGRDRLAVISSPASEWVVRPSPLPGRTVLERRDRWCQRCGGRGYL
jgi:hypothetical protein